MSLRFLLLLLLNSKSINLTILFKSLKVLFKSLISPKLKYTFLIHKDLKQNKNHFVDDNKITAFYDFELTKTTNKFFLLDIVDLAMNQETFKLDFDLINQYLNYVQDLKLDFKRIKNQIRFLAIRYHLHQIRHYRLDSKQLFKSLLNDFSLHKLKL
jgi:hypothetical protein